MKPQWLLALKLVKMLSWQLIREYNIFYTRAFDGLAKELCHDNHVFRSKYC